MYVQTETKSLNPVVADRREMLRVKVKSLAAEATIIRREERRTAPGRLREELYHHRVGIVRSAARHAVLALGLIRGLTLEQMEPVSYSAPNIATINAMIKKYGPTGTSANRALLLEEHDIGRYQVKAQAAARIPRQRSRLTRDEYEARKAEHQHEAIAA